MRATLLAGWAHDANAMRGLGDALSPDLEVRLAGFADPVEAQDDVLVGWSLGGLRAMEIAARAPARLKALVLISSTPRFCSDDEFPCGAPEAELRALMASLRRNPEAAVDRFTRFAAQPNERIYTPPPGEPGKLAEGLRYLQKTDLRELVPSLTCPTLLLHGLADRVVPPAASEWLAARVPSACFTAYEGIGHDLPLRSCKELANAIQRFLA